VLAIADLGSAIRRRVGGYSQGMRQRLAIAQAMLGMPELLVLDEPTNGLDPPQIVALRGVLRGYAEAGRTVIVSSHLLTEVERTCTHLVVMSRGRVVAAGPVAEVAGGTDELVVEVDHPTGAAAALRAIGVGVTEPIGTDTVRVQPRARTTAEIVAALVAAGIGVSDLRHERRLEDAFLELIGEGATP
jgi:ABC-2 type transport system ATP-binding protein